MAVYDVRMMKNCGFVFFRENISCNAYDHVIKIIASLEREKPMTIDRAKIKQRAFANLNVKGTEEEDIEDAIWYCIRATIDALIDEIEKENDN